MANDTTLTLSYPTGATIYTQIFDPSNNCWNGTAFVSFVVASWTSFATSTPETPASSGFYVCQFPTGAAAGNYRWRMMLRAGGSPASSDVCVGTGAAWWDGTTFGGASSVTNNVLASNGLDSVIIEPAALSQPAINARQALNFVFNAAPGGIQTNVSSANPQIWNPAGNVLRATLTVDANNNRTGVTFNNLP